MILSLLSILTNQYIMQKVHFLGIIKNCNLSSDFKAFSHDTCVLYIIHDFYLLDNVISLILYNSPIVYFKIGTIFIKISLAVTFFISFDSNFTLLLRCFNSQKLF